MEQTRTKLTQESQQYKKDNNILQTDLEKVSNLEFNLFSVKFSTFSSGSLSSSCLAPDVFSEESSGEGGGGAETEAAALTAEPPGQPDQRGGPLQETKGNFKWLLPFFSHLTLSVPNC